MVKSSPRVVAASFTVEQDADSCAMNSLGQWLTVKVEDAGGGPFYVLETERWAVDSFTELQKTLDSIHNVMVQLMSFEGEPAE